MGRMDGVVALISGGARGMGASHARAIVAEGGTVVVGDVLDGEGAALAAELGDACRYIHLDVREEAHWARAVGLAEEAFGHLTALVSNAAVTVLETVEHIAPEDFRRVVDINLTGVYLGMRAVAPSMRRAGGGVIINISSTAGLIAYASTAPYVASKWGVRGLTKAAAMELAPDNIRVVSVHPGAIRSPMAEGTRPEAFRYQPVPRIGEPEEVSKMILYLIADATYSTGCEFVIDGGATLIGPGRLSTKQIQL